MSEREDGREPDDVPFAIAAANALELLRATPDDAIRADYEAFLARDVVVRGQFHQPEDR